MRMTKVRNGMDNTNTEVKMKFNCLSARFVFRVFLIGILFFGFASMPSFIYAEGEYVIICNASNPVSSISSVDVMNIFLGKKVSWDNGQKITFVTLNEGESHKQFLREKLKKNPQQFKNYWKKMLFTGKGVIPRSFPDDAGVIDFVSQNEAAIGYISKQASAQGIKTIQITN